MWELHKEVRPGERTVSTMDRNVRVWMLLPELGSTLYHFTHIFLTWQTLALQANMARGKIGGYFPSVQAVLCREIDDEPDRPAIGAAVDQQPRHRMGVLADGRNWKALSQQLLCQRCLGRDEPCGPHWLATAWFRRPFCDLHRNMVYGLGPLRMAPMCTLKPGKSYTECNGNQNSEGTWERRGT